MAACFIAVALASPNGHAGLITDYDLTAFDFEITSVTNSAGNPASLGSNFVLNDATLTGTSGGIGWTAVNVATWLARTTTSNNASFVAPSTTVTTDRFHPSADFTITFDQTIESLLVALSNNSGGTDSINFGLTPSDSEGVTFTGTQATLTSPNGALALFENVNSLTITHTNTNELDGFDLAFWAVEVPAPAPLLLIGVGLLGLAARLHARGNT